MVIAISDIFLPCTRRFEQQMPQCKREPSPQNSLTLERPRKGAFTMLDDLARGQLMVDVDDCAGPAWGCDFFFFFDAVERCGGPGILS